MPDVDAKAAYQRGWNRCRHYDNSAADFESCRARFAARHGDDLACAWEEGWLDAAGAAS